MSPDPWAGWRSLLGDEVIDAARACRHRVSSLDDLATFRGYRPDPAGGVAWLRSLPAPRLAGLLDTVTGVGRLDLVEAWKVAKNEAQ